MDYHQIRTQHPAGSPRRTALCSLAVGIALFSLASRARATDLAGAELGVARSAAAYDCPDAPALAQSSAALGSAPAPPGSPLRLEVHFDRRLDGYAARIEASGRKRGTRELFNPSTTCGPLAEAVSVVLAILTDLIPQPPDAPALLPAVVPAPAPPPVPRPAIALAAGPEFGVAYGLVGRAATATAAAAVRARYRSAELELGALWSTPHFESVEPGVVSTSLLAGTALGCLWLGAEARTTLGACAGLGIGSLHGSGHGYDHDGEASTVWVAAFGGIAAQVRLRPRWACRLALSAVVPLQSDTFAVAPDGQGIRSAPLAIFLRFGPEYRFW